MKGSTITKDQCCLCGKTKDQVLKLIVGLHGGVCSDCIEICQDIIQNPKSSEFAPGLAAWDGKVVVDPRLRDVFLSPRAVEDALSSIASLIRAYTAEAAQAELEP